MPLAGRLVATGDGWEPYRLLDGAAKAAHGEWNEMRRSIGLDILATSRTATTAASSTAEEVTLTAITT